VIRHPTSNNDNGPISFDSTKEQNTPLKDLGRLIVKKELSKTEKDKR
jgi:hypothetical protein